MVLIYNTESSLLGIGFKIDHYSDITIDMEYISALLQSRCSRTNLDTTKEYIMVKKIDGKIVEEEVGKFIKSYQADSGDGMTLHWEFLKNGFTIRIDDEMWGSVNGSELTGFRKK